MKKNEVELRNFRLFYGASLLHRLDFLASYAGDPPKSPVMATRKYRLEVLKSTVEKEFQKFAFQS